MIIQNEKDKTISKKRCYRTNKKGQSRSVLSYFSNQLNDLNSFHKQVKKLKVQKNCNNVDSHKGDDKSNGDEESDIENDGTTGIINKIKAIRWNEKLWRLEHQVEWEGYGNDEYWHPYEDIKTYPDEHGQQKSITLQ